MVQVQVTASLYITSVVLKGFSIKWSLLIPFKGLHLQSQVARYNYSRRHKIMECMRDPMQNRYFMIPFSNNLQQKKRYSVEEVDCFD